MSKISWKGGTLLSPVPPALITCSDGEKTNVFTAAWTGILCSDPPKTYISVRPSRYSHSLISRTKEFVINLPTVELVRTVDFCGVKSGRDIDKLSVCKLETSPSSQVSVPGLAASPVSLECRVFQIVPLGSHDMFMADIVAVDVESELISESGKLCLEKTNLLAYSHGEYHSLGKCLGTFGFSVRKKKKNPRR